MKTAVTFESGGTSAIGSVIRLDLQRMYSEHPIANKRADEKLKKASVEFRRRHTM